MTVQQLNRVLVPPQGIYITIWCTTLSWTEETKTSTHAEDAKHEHTDPRLAGTGRVMIKIPKTSLCYLTTNQSEESHAPCSPHPKCCYQGAWVFWALAAHSPCFVSCNKCCTFPHHNLVSVDWLCCAEGKWTQVQFHLYAMSRIGKFMGTESRWLVA